MYQITNIVTVNEVDICVWNVVFNMDHHPVQFSTDFLYLVREKVWVFNSLMTHEVSSLMLGHQCPYCREEKIACTATSSAYLTIKKNVIKHEHFQQAIKQELSISKEDVSSEYVVINDKEKWIQLAEENRFHANIFRIKNKRRKKP